MVNTGRDLQNTLEIILCIALNLLYLEEMVVNLFLKFPVRFTKHSRNYTLYCFEFVVFRGDGSQSIPKISPPFFSNT